MQLLKMLRLFSFAAIVILLSACSDESGEEASYNETELEILQLINQYRIIHNLEELSMDESMYLHAVVHTKYMIDQESISHANFESRANALSEEIGASAFAENVAAGQRNAQAVVDAWLNSSGHKENIEGDYNLTGIAAIRNNEGVMYYTQIFARSN